MKLYKRFNSVLAYVIPIAIATGCAFSTPIAAQTAYTPSQLQSQIGEVQPQLIEEFYHNEKAASTPAPKNLFTIERQDLISYHPHVNTNVQRESTNELASENGDDAKNIGGLDYSAPGVEQDAEDMSNYDDLFLANQLNNGQAFDPSKMTDSIKVYLVSPRSSGFHMPVAGNKINSDYGWRHGRFHSGVDLDLDLGDTVVAAFDGIVQKSEYYGGYGNLVVLKNFNGLETYYAHLSKLKVDLGDTIKAGQLVGLGGSTGHSTGPHLHFEVRYRGAAIDPKYIIDIQDRNLRSDTYCLTKNSFRPSQAAAEIASKTTGKYYVVHKGDTLGRIASRYGTTVNRLCSLNGISSKKVLKPGMKLRVH